VDEELSASRRARLERHASECAECRRLLAGLRATLAALHGLPAASDSSYALQLAASVHRRLKEPPGRR
jgi:anti-sigma factor RsiW